MVFGQKAVVTATSTPNEFPIRVLVPAGTKRVISFPNRFFGIATAIILSNEDGADKARYRFEESQDFIDLPANQFRTVDFTLVRRLEIDHTVATGGPIIVEAQVTPFTNVEIGQNQNAVDST